jgi:dihydroceramide fatty acyl 2-hydroxylase
MSATTSPPSRRSDALRASPPLFKSPYLDRLTRVHPVVPVVLYGPVILLLLVLAAGRTGAPLALALIAGGYLLWTLSEYWIHRVVFHFAPEQGVGARVHFLIHGVHHDHPNDPNRLVMPPAASLPLAACFLAVFSAVFGAAWPAMGAGFLSGYVFYDSLHYHLHHRVPKSALGRRLRELHMRHHFQDHTRGYGISAPYWDRIFGTATFPRRDPSRPD